MITPLIETTGKTRVVVINRSPKDKTRDAVINHSLSKGKAREVVISRSKIETRAVARVRVADKEESLIK